MSRPLRIRIRWIDMLTLRAPRYVIDGVLLHREPSKRIRWIAGRETRAAFWQRGPERSRLWWSTFFGMILTWPYIAFFFFKVLPWAMNTVDAWFDELPELLDTLFAIAFGFVLGIGMIPVMYVAGWISIWGMRPQLIRAIRAVAADTCLVCDYDLRGHAAESRCPECGASRILTRIAKE